MDNYDVIKKLLGHICPVGETHEDGRRYDNLEETIAVVSRLLADISAAARDRSRTEFSMQKAGSRAAEFLRCLGDELSDDHSDTE